MSEHEILSVCHAPVDSPARNRGLTLKRVKKLGNRKQVERFFGEAVPQPSSPTSPTYFSNVATPREATSRSGLSAGQKKMNRASTISVMAGLGVPGARQGNTPPPPYISASIPATSLPPADRSPSSGSFLANKGRKMYNFFGHRPPSELISTHLADYFPKVQKKVLERTARNSVMRIISGDGSDFRTSWATGGEGSARLSSSSFGDSVISPRKKRISQGGRSIASNLSGPKGNFNRISSSPPRTAIPEDASEDDHNDMPRVSISTDGVSGSESDVESVDSRPPLLPPVDTSQESWSDSLAVYSPEYLKNDSKRRNSIASTSRMSLLSQFRKKKDTSDTASFLTVDEITAHVDKKRSSKHSLYREPGPEDDIELIDNGDEEEDEEDLRTPAPLGRRASRNSRLGELMSYYENTDEDSTGEDEQYYSEEEEEVEEEGDDEDDEDEIEEEEDEQGKAFLSEGGELVRSFDFDRSSPH